MIQTTTRSTPVSFNNQITETLFASSQPQKFVNDVLLSSTLEANKIWKTPTDLKNDSLSSVDDATMTITITEVPLSINAPIDTNTKLKTNSSFLFSDPETNTFPDIEKLSEIKHKPSKIGDVLNKTHESGGSDVYEASVFHVNIWNYLNGQHKITQSHYNPTTLNNNLNKPHHSVNLPQIFINQISQNGTQKSPSKESNIFVLDHHHNSISNPDFISEQQLEPTNDSIHPQDNIKKFPNLYEFILYREANKNETNNQKTTQTEATNQKLVSTSEEPIRIHSFSENHYIPIKEGTFIYHPEDHNISQTTEFPLKKATYTIENISNFTNQSLSSELDTIKKDENLDKYPNYQPTQNFYQIFQESNNLNSNILNNNHHNQQTIHINNPPHLTSSNLPGWDQNLGDQVTEANQVESNIKVINSSLSSSPLKLNEMLSTDSLTSSTENNNANVNFSTTQNYLTNGSFFEYPNKLLNIHPINEEEIPIDLSIVHQENFNNEATQSNIDSLRDIDAATLVNEYIKRINAVSKVFNHDDLNKPEIEELIENIALESLLAYLLGEEDHLTAELAYGKSQTSVINQNYGEKVTSFYPNKVNQGTLENGESLWFPDIPEDITDTAYRILSKLISESTNQTPENVLSLLTNQNSLSELSKNIGNDSSDNYNQNSTSSSTKTLNSTPQLNRISTDKNSQQLFEQSSELIYDYNDSYDYTDDLATIPVLTNTKKEPFIPQKSSFTDTIKNSVSTVTKMISDLVPNDVTFEWCIQNTGCSFALASSLAIGATGALAIPLVIPFGRRRRQIFLGESRIFKDDQFETNKRLEEEFQRILSVLALYKGKRKGDGFVIDKQDLLKYLKEEYNNIIEWKKKKKSKK